MTHRTLFLLLVLLCIATTAEEESFIGGKVLDSEGAAIGNARVLVHWDPAGSTVGLVDNIGIMEDKIVTTSRDGSYELKVPPGFYDVFVSAMAFTPSASKVRVKPALTAKYIPRLNPDPLVIKELGHSIE